MKNDTKIEQQLRNIFSEEFIDIDPPENFTENILAKLPEVESRTSYQSFKHICGGMWDKITRPITFSFSPLQLAVVLIVFCGSAVVFAPLNFSKVASRPVTMVKQQPVRFALYDPEQKFSSAVVIGSFNKWQSRGFEMSYDEQQKTWILEHELPEGDYEYVFLVNGESSIPDPRALFYVQDNFGNKNSLIQVGGVRHDL